ncbi:MAG: PAS domain S-box protein [Ferruginibacter sp.]
MSDEFAAGIIKKGADDYILKDRLGRLPAAIHNSLQKFRLQRERQVYLDELIQREKRFATLIENGADAVVILNEKGSPIFASSSVTRVLGYSVDEVLHLDIFSIAHPDDLPAISKVMEQVLANPGIAIKGHTGRMLHKDGSWRWLEATVTNLLHDPAIHGIVDNFRDVTESRIAAEKLVENENKFRRLIENGSDGIAILSADGKPTYVSPSIINVLGYTQEEGMQLDLLELAHPEDVPVLIGIMQAALAQPGVPIAGNATRMRHKNGSWRWVDGVLTNMIHDPAINGIVDNFRDVTDKKIAEEKVMQANRLYNFISQINQTIVHSRDEQTVFREACRIAIENGKFKAAWIGIFNTQNNKVDLVERCGIADKDILHYTDISYAPGRLQFSVLENNCNYICNDIPNDPALLDWKDFAEKAGIASLMVLPIRKSGNIIGTFNFYASGIDFFTSAEVALLNEATTDISFALGIFQKEKIKVQDDEKLLESESRLKQAQALAHLGSWEMNYATGVVIWSDEQLKIFGLSPEQKEQSLQSWLSFIHPEDIDNVLKATGETKSCLNVADYFHRIVRRDGTIRHIYAQTRVKVNHDGTPTGLYGVTQDVTDVRNAELALQESESNLQAIFENTSEGFILADINGVIKSFNPRSSDILRLNSEQHISIGSSIFEYIHPARKNMYRQSIEKVLAGETLWYDYPYTRKDGDIKWFDFKVNPVYVGGEISGLCITSTDITERKQAEELLRRSESNLNAVIENTDAFIYSLDKDFRYIIFNKALQKMMKEVYGLDIIPGFKIFDFINKFDNANLEEWKEIYSRALGGEIIKFEKEFVVDKQYNYNSFSIHPIWENKEVIGLSCFVHDITNQKKAEAETRFQANLLNIIGQAAIATDSSGMVNYWNKAAEVIYGWTNEDAIGRNVIDLIPSDQTNEQGIRIMDDLKQGNSWSGEFIFQRKDGTNFPAFVTESAIYDKNHTLTGLITVSSDITYKKNLENLLDKANLLARIGSWEVDVEKKSLFWSSVTKFIHGVADDFIPDIATAISLYKAGPSRQAVTVAITEAMELGKAFDLELQIVTPAGSECWVRANGQAEFLDDQCVRVYGSFQDIDKSKKAEIEVLNAYQEKNIILESIGDAFFAVDGQWIVTYWNNQAETMLQTPKNKILGHNLWDVFSDSIDSASYKNYQLAIQTRQVVRFKDYLESLDKWFEINACPSDKGLSVFFKDITHQKKSEDEREKMTADLLQRNAALEQFSYIISHNLRAPVANIKGLAATLQKKDLNHILKEKVMKGLSTSVNQLDEVIKDLHEILKIRQELNEHKQLVGFTKLVDNIRTSIENKIESKKAVIICDFSAINEMLTIRSYLHSIFYNLITNSLKYSQPGIPPEIEIVSQRLPGKVLLHFKDNGVGIDLAKRGEDVFGLFKRFHTTLAEGKGMGLYLVKTQVEALGGKINVASEVNKGSSFKIEFEIK